MQHCAQYCVQLIISGVDTRCNIVHDKQAILMARLPNQCKPKWRNEKLLLLLLFFFCLQKRPKNERKPAEVSGCEIDWAHLMALWRRWPLHAMLREAATRCNCCFHSCSIACNIARNNFRGGHMVQFTCCAPVVRAMRKPTNARGLVREGRVICLVSGLSASHRIVLHDVSLEGGSEMGRKRRRNPACSTNKAAVSSEENTTLEDKVGKVGRKARGQKKDGIAVEKHSPSSKTGDPPSVMEANENEKNTRENSGEWRKLKG